jgi:hypothetical protein
VLATLYRCNAMQVSSGEISVDMSCHAGPPGDQTAGPGRPNRGTGGSFPLLRALTCTAADGIQCKHNICVYIKKWQEAVSGLHNFAGPLIERAQGKASDTVPHHLPFLLLPSFPSLSHRHDSLLCLSCCAWIMDGDG